MKSGVRIFLRPFSKGAPRLNPKIRPVLDVVLQPCVQLEHHAVEGHNQVPITQAQGRVILYDVKVSLLIERDIFLKNAQDVRGTGDGRKHFAALAGILPVGLKSAYGVIGAVRIFLDVVIIGKLAYGVHGVPPVVASLSNRAKISLTLYSFSPWK